MTPEQIDQLDELQSKENNGRGIACVRAILIHLRRGDNEDAWNVFEHDRDKIRYYPEVEKFLEQTLEKKMKYASFKGARKQFKPKVFTHKNRYQDLYTFTEMENGNVLMAGPFESMQVTMANDYTDAYLKYQEDGGTKTLLSFIQSHQQWCHDKDHALNKYAPLVCANPSIITMIDPSGGPDIHTGSTKYSFGRPVTGFQKCEKGYILLTENV